jgi:hypothetical protein
MTTHEQTTAFVTLVSSGTAVKQSIFHILDSLEVSFPHPGMHYMVHPK